MPVLMWDKPPRAESVEEWMSRSADGAPPGVYSPNMSEEHMLAWKAKMAGHRKRGMGHDPRVEIRKTAFYRPADRSERSFHAEILIVVRPPGDGGHSRIRISMNGTADMTEVEWTEMQMAIGEAQLALAELDG